ncbi:hypothetical protein [Deinococcus pimensis]|uniref:hypothetical protein n=1 Tax=Deinococcus pimensis TaxID=309888 RepID=UPI0004876B35|nr:hypothetical protein [Deinococcus pimensis]
MSRPSEPLPAKPAGYLHLESYSSLRRLWTFLDAAERAGRRVVVTRGDTDATCRRRVEGYALKPAGALLDVQRATTELDEEFGLHPALLALASGDPAPLVRLLDETYELRATFTLAFTRSRDLVMKPDLRYVPLGPDELGLKLVPRRLSRDELRFLLHRACGMA